METLPQDNPLRPEAVVTAGVSHADILADRERRRDHRRPAIVKATVTVLDGLAAGVSHEVLTRDLSSSGVSFLLRDGLAVGQRVKLTVQNGKTTHHTAEVIRSRPLSNGKHEMAVVFRS